MTKLHILVAHSKDVVNTYGSIGGISEESFEHNQSISADHRKTHSRNMSIGMQLAEDLNLCMAQGPS